MNRVKKAMVCATNLSKMFTAFFILGIAVSAPHLFASAPWTAVGSTGTVDESDLSIVSMNHGMASVKSSAPAGSTLNVRYNIVGLESLANGGGGFTLQARYRDNGSGARVRLRVKRYNKNGSITTLHTFDSNNYSASSFYQTEFSLACFTFFNFDDHSYFIDAEITKSSSTGTPSLGWIQIEPVNSCVP